MKVKVALLDKFKEDFTEKDFKHYATGFLNQDCEVFQLDPYTIDFSRKKGDSYILKLEKGIFKRESQKREKRLSSFDIIVDLSDIVDYNFAKELSKIDVLHINPPLATFNSANKSTYIDNYPEFIPETIVSSNAREIIDYMRNHITPGNIGNFVVIKDPFGSHGRGVERVDIRKDSSIKEVNKFTQNGKREIVAQKFIHFASEGAKRITIVGDKDDPNSYRIIQFNRRVPSEGCWKDNLDFGGKIVNLEKLREDERELSLEVAARSGLYTLSLDIMDDLDKNGKRVSRLVETNSVLALGVEEYKHIIYQVTRHILDKLNKSKWK